MRTHSQIIDDAGGPGTLRVVLRQHGFDLPDPTVRAWRSRANKSGSIPAAYWPALTKAKLASLDELARHAEALAKGRAA